MKQALMLRCGDTYTTVFAHLKRLHHHLFQDLYEWAGHSNVGKYSRNQRAIGGVGVVWGKEHILCTVSLM